MPLASPSLAPTRNIHIHLFLPFCSSVLVIFGLLYLKKAQENGATAWSCLILMTWSCALVFPVLLLLDGKLQAWHLMWQPAVIGALFLAGQYFGIMSIKVGDVSIAAPVQGIKVLLVPALAVLLVDEPMTSRILLAASVALIGIVFVQITDHTIDRSRIIYSIMFALLAAFSMTLFDLFIQRWAPAWGAGYFLPLALGFAALFSLAFVPLANRPSELKNRDVLVPLVLGCVFMTLQAIGMTVTLARWGDATRVNIVYSLRGLWGVILTWALSHHIKIAQHRPNNKIMLMRLIGALLIGTSVVISIL